MPNEISSSQTHSPTDHCPAELLLGLELRRLRESRGLTQNQTAKLVGLSARSAVADYESGRRLPPADIVLAYERAFALPAGALQLHRGRTLSGRAARRHDEAVAKRVATPAETAPQSSQTRFATGVVSQPSETAQAGAVAAPGVVAPTLPDGPLTGRRQYWRSLHAARLLSAVLCVAGCSVLLSGSVQAGGLDPTWSARNQHVTDRSERNTPPEDMDGDDPRARDCFADAVVVQAVPFTMPDGTPGTLRLRHSAKCGASWASAYYSNPALATVKLAAHRPADGAQVRSEWSNDTPPGSYGDLLSTVGGCVWVEVSVVANGAASAPVRTDCRS